MTFEWGTLMTTLFGSELDSTFYTFDRILFFIGNKSAQLTRKMADFAAESFFASRQSFCHGTPFQDQNHCTHGSDNMYSST